MNKLGIFIFLFFYAEHSFSQRIPRKYRKYFKDCCEAKKTNIRNLIEIDGYYTMGFVHADAPADTFNSSILFYEDGFHVTNWGNYKTMTNKEYLMEVDKNGAKDYFYKNILWGQYEIRNDTIITRSILPGTVMRHIRVEEDIFKILNRTTIIQVSHRDMTDLKSIDTPNIKYLNATFTHSDIIPSGQYSWMRRLK